MNEKFFSLPEEKQLAIINAGYRVFSQNSYKKSPMIEIAAEADISKSLLFYYFRNKKELYLYDELYRIICPTYIIGGDNDKTVGGQASYEMNERIANSRLHIYNGLGHAA